MVWIDTQISQARDLTTTYSMSKGGSGSRSRVYRPRSPKFATLLGSAASYLQGSSRDTDTYVRGKQLACHVVKYYFYEGAYFISVRRLPFKILSPMAGLRWKIAALLASTASHLEGP